MLSRRAAPACVDAAASPRWRTSTSSECAAVARFSAERLTNSLCRKTSSPDIPGIDRPAAAADSAAGAIVSAGVAVAMIGAGAAPNSDRARAIAAAA
jgi:hypothetical protein